MDTQALKELANLRIEEVLDALGIDYRDRYSYLVGCCHVHGGDRADAFSWHIERGIWKCFSRGCDDRYGADIYGLIRGMRKCSFAEAKDWLRRFLNTELNEEEIKLLRDSRSNKDFIVYTKKKQQADKIYPPECLTKLDRHDYLIEERGFSREIVEEYQVGFCSTSGTFMYNRIVFPCVNTRGEIIGFTGRTIDPDWEDKKIPKWKHSLGNWVQNNVFNAHRAHDHIQTLSEVIVCEGPLDILRLEEAGVHNAVAVLGKEIKNGQITLLMNMGAMKLNLAFDNDAAGKVGTQKALKTASMYFDINVIDLPEDKNDVGDLTRGEIREVFSV